MKRLVKDYLMEHFGFTEDQALTAMDAPTGRKFIQDAVRWNSLPHFPAEQIAHNLGRQHLDPCPACKAEEIAAGE